MNKTFLDIDLEFLKLFTVSRWTFPAAAYRIWNTLPDNVVSTFSINSWWFSVLWARFIQLFS